MRKLGIGAQGYLAIGFMVAAGFAAQFDQLVLAFGLIACGVFLTCLEVGKGTP